jgi:hypothetical protein
MHVHISALLTKRRPRTAGCISWGLRCMGHCPTSDGAEAVQPGCTRGRLMGRQTPANMRDHSTTCQLASS